MKPCPYCHQSEGQVKNGLNPSGTQRYLCRSCQRAYTPEPKSSGYDEATRHEALQLDVDGMNLRRIARTLSVNHHSVANWIKAYAAQLPSVPVPPAVKTIELDELFTFVEKKSPFTS
jgi:transposase-like protein